MRSGNYSAKSTNSKDKSSKKPDPFLFYKKLDERSDIVDRYKENIRDFYQGYESNAEISFDDINAHIIKHGKTNLALKDLPQVEAIVNSWHLKATKIFCVLTDMVKQNNPEKKRVLKSLYTTLLTSKADALLKKSEKLSQVDPMALLSASAIYASMHGIFMNTKNPTQADKDYKGMVEFQPDYLDPLYDNYKDNGLNLNSLNNPYLLLENGFTTYKDSAAKSKSNSIKFFSSQIFLKSVCDTMMDSSGKPQALAFQKNLMDIHMKFYQGLTSRPEKSPDRIILLPSRS